MNTVWLLTCCENMNRGITYKRTIRAYGRNMRKWNKRFFSVE